LGIEVISECKIKLFDSRFYDIREWREEKDSGYGLL
jgi:hypothetical protein